MAINESHDWKAPGQLQLHHAPWVYEDSVILWADLVGGHALAASMSPQRFVSAVAAHCNHVVGCAVRCGGEYLRTDGDAALVAFRRRNLANALRCAVEMQETRGRQRPFTVAIAAGWRPVNDHLWNGPLVELAHSLGRVGAKHSILIEAGLREATEELSVESKAGKRAVRKRAEYLSPIYAIRFQSFSDPVEYFEFVWSSTGFGVRKKKG